MSVKPHSIFVIYPVVSHISLNASFSDISWWNIIWHQFVLCPLITARKRSLRRLCFHRCLSVHRGEGASMACTPHGHACPLGTHAPPQTLPLGMQPPRHEPQELPGTPPRHAHHPRHACHPRHAPLGMHAPQGCMPPTVYYEMCSMSRRHTSYWNAFLFFEKSEFLCLLADGEMIGIIIVHYEV